MFKFIRKLHLNEAGATAIEYSLIAALVGVAIIATATTLGEAIAQVFADLTLHISPGSTAADGG